MRGKGATCTSDRRSLMFAAEQKSLLCHRWCHSSKSESLRAADDIQRGPAPSIVLASILDKTSCLSCSRASYSFLISAILWFLCAAALACSCCCARRLSLAHKTLCFVNSCWEALYIGRSVYFSSPDSCNVGGTSPYLKKCVNIADFVFMCALWTDDHYHSVPHGIFS